MTGLGANREGSPSLTLSPENKGSLLRERSPQRFPKRKKILSIRPSEVRFLEQTQTSIPAEVRRSWRWGRMVSVMRKSWYFWSRSQVFLPISFLNYARLSTLTLCNSLPLSYPRMT